MASSSFDHLVGEQLHRVGNHEAERLRSLEIDHELPQPSGWTTFASSYPASTKCHLPSFSRETWSLTVSALKIGEISGSFWRGAGPEPSVHPLTGTELRALRRLQREQKPGRYVFMSERGAPMSAVAFRRMVTRLGQAAKMPFGIHPHMLRHSTGFKLAYQGVDTRSLQHYLGHKNIQHTVRYSELSPDRFRDFWKD
jgi:integrase